YLYRGLPQDRSALYVSALAWGVYSGTLATAAIRKNPSSELVLGMGVVGEAVFLTGAWAAADRLGLSAADVALAGLGGAAGAVLALGILDLLPSRADQRPAFALTLGAGLAGLGLTGAVAKRLHFTEGDSALTALGGAEGAYWGALVPTVVSPQ